MNREQLKQMVKQQMPEQRWQHTLGVIEASLHLADRYGADRDQAELAAILHDYAKYWPTEALRQIIRNEGLPAELLQYDKQLWHAPVGAFIAEHELGIDDEHVLNAIRYHTSGRAGMTLLEKVICVADYIEPGRVYPGVESIRRLAEDNLDHALIAGFDTTIRFLLEQGKPIFPLTILARNDIILINSIHQNQGG